MIFSRHESNSQRVAALDSQATALGLRNGIGVAEARAMYPAIEVVEADPDGDRLLLEALADWCDRFTPLVAIDGDDGLFLDITGCTHLFGGESSMLEEMLLRFRAQGFSVRGAIASTPGGAWAAAHYGAADCQIVPAGKEAKSIASLPLAALRLDAAIRAGLESVGLRTIGGLLDIARAPLVRRFGKSVTLRLDQALGQVREAISPRLPVPSLAVERHFFDPVSLLEDIEDLVGIMARQLRSALERRGEGALQLQLQLFRVDGLVARIGIAASQPLRDAHIIRRLFQEKLAAAAPNLDPGFGFDLIRLAVQSSGPFAEDQARLDAANADRSSDIALFADRVRIRLGGNAITRPIQVASHIPELAMRLLAFGATQMASKESSLPRHDSRPIRLFDRPEQIEITAAEVPDGPPSHFRWRRISYHVVAAEGPERIAPEWWKIAIPKVDEVDPLQRRKAEHEAFAAETARITRDYFRVEDTAGRRFWIYRQGSYFGDARPTWFMQGLFA